MKTVKALVSFATMDAGYAAGDIIELSDERASEYVECGYCTPEAGAPEAQGEPESQGTPEEKEGKADAVSNEKPAGGRANKPGRRKAASAG